MTFFMQRSFFKILFFIVFIAIDICHAFHCILLSRSLDSQIRVPSSYVNYHRNHPCLPMKMANWVMAATKSQPADIQIGTSRYDMIPNAKTNVLYQRKGRIIPWLTRKPVTYTPTSKISFEYNYNQLIITSPTESTMEKRTKIIVLVHPIGVGIGRWYYDRLLNEIQNIMTSRHEERTQYDEDLMFLVPDLLACGSASNPKLYNDEIRGNFTSDMKQIPLLQTQDWSNQILDLMTKQESTVDGPIDYYIVSNGGCIPIALDIANRQLLHDKNKSSTHPHYDTSTRLRGRVTHLILSAPPQISSLIKARDDVLVQKSYKTLTGIAGKIFWWYALRNNGAFIQKFSEKNLASNPDNLGSEWRQLCVETASANQGRSRYSTFAFLAGSLNGGNLEVLDGLKTDKILKIDIIAGGDTRRNKAKSWFWNRSKKSRVGDEDVALNQENSTVDTDILQPENTTTITTTTTTLFQFLKENGFSVKEVTVGGRRCPAHEDAKGFAQVLLKILQSS